MDKKTKQERKKTRVRMKVLGVANKPRLSVFRSNKFIYAQLIDDQKGMTLVDVSAEAKQLHKKGTRIEAAAQAGKLLAKKALEKGIKEAKFDRGKYKYHGRVKSLAEAAREGGLKI